MQTERILGIRLPSFVGRFIRGTSAQPEITPSNPKAQAGTNKFFMALDGTHFRGESVHWRGAYADHVGPGETLDIEREVIEDGRTCEGGVCVEVVYRKWGTLGQDALYVKAHITGNEQIRFAFAQQDAEIIPVESGLNIVRERLAQLGITTSENHNPTSNC